MAATSAPQTAKAEASALQEQAQTPPLDALHADGLVRTPSTRCRSSSAARAATSGTTTATATSTASRRSSASTPGTVARELGDAMAAQVRELDFITVWSYAHPRAIELATRISSLTPGDLNRVFFTNSGSEAVESAIKLARSYHRSRGNGQKTKLIAREIAYHGTTLGRPERDRHPGASQPVRAARPGRRPRSQHQQLPLARGPRPTLGGRPDRGGDPVRGPRDGRRRDPRAAPERRRLHPSPGRLLPAGPGDLRPLRRPVDLGRGDLRLGSARPLLRLPALRLPARHHHRRPRRSPPPTSRWAAMIVSDRVFEPFSEGTAMFAHGSTFAGHPVAAATAMANLDVFEREDLCGHVLREGGRVPRGARVALRHPDRR